jgi:hypothetical protein
MREVRQNSTEDCENMTPEEHMSKALDLVENAISKPPICFLCLFPIEAKPQKTRWGFAHIGCLLQEAADCEMPDYD